MEVVLLGEASLLIGKMSHSHALLLMNSGNEVDRKLFHGEPDHVKVEMENSVVRMKYTFEKKPGYLVTRHHLHNVKRICGTWLLNPMINKSGLACMIWDDNVASVLRRRLDQKVARNTLTITERQKINEVVKKLASDVNNMARL